MEDICSIYISSSRIKNFVLSGLKHFLTDGRSTDKLTDIKKDLKSLLITDKKKDQILIFEKPKLYNYNRSHRTDVGTIFVLFLHGNE